jgi:hypothetical protein
MSKKQMQMLTARQFAEQMEIDYRTALNWLDAELVPGAVRKGSLVGEYWEIPPGALNMERPKRGPKPGAKASANGNGKKKGGKK